MLQIPSDLLDYADSHCTQPPALAARIASSTSSSPQAYLMVGNIVGSLLRCLVSIQSPSSALEIGSFHGYSAAMILSCLSPLGKLWVFEDDTERYAKLRSNLADDIAKGRVVAMNSHGFQWLAHQSIRFDMIFLDGRKEDYPDNYQLIKERLSPGGILAVDNTMYKGRVLNPTKPWEHAIHAFNKIISEDSDMVTCMLPIRDGFTVAVKQRLN